LRSPAYERDEMTTLNETRGDAVAHLLADAKRFPMLSPERELELAVAWRVHADDAALRDLRRQPFAPGDQNRPWF
jgi:hypothetical protein